jgi:hypothetical protein
MRSTDDRVPNYAVIAELTYHWGPGTKVREVYPDKCPSGRHDHEPGKVLIGFSQPYRTVHCTRCHDTGAEKTTWYLLKPPQEEFWRQWEDYRAGW